MVKLTFSAGQLQLFKQPWSHSEPTLLPARQTPEAEVIEYLLAIVNRLDEELRQLKIRLPESNKTEF